VIFADHTPAQYVAKVRSIELLTPTVALLRAVVGMIPPGESDLNPERNAHQTLLARKDGEICTTNSPCSAPVLGLGASQHRRE